MAAIVSLLLALLLFLLALQTPHPHQNLPPSPPKPSPSPLPVHWVRAEHIRLQIWYGLCKKRVWAYHQALDSFYTMLQTWLIQSRQKRVRAVQVGRRHGSANECRCRFVGGCRRDAGSAEMDLMSLTADVIAN
ncbi:hypothetical protein C1H46_005373 [Malus baccata]|uniref:Uncharacterized protein n=1 Tax=Malus baccata TaxID=106549 RepID=A0A540NEP7_MALBA|nr:hypothetical protein C1H46_005373 [Malus baccata]